MAGNLDTFPSLVMVHGIIPSDDDSKFTVILRLEELEQLFGIPLGRSGCGVATVAKEVNIGVRYALLFCGLEEGYGMTNVGVDTAVRDL